MPSTSDYLDKIITKKNRTCNMQVVFVDIVSYSKRKPYAQISLIDAFMICLKESLSETAKKYIKYCQDMNINFSRDIIVLPSGDGAAIGFPFEGVPDMHLFFAKEIVKNIFESNTSSNCPKFDSQGWCDCHAFFSVRIGISEGTSILYHDYNSNYNIAGNTINMSARVMNIAESNQIFFTKEAYHKLIDLVSNIDNKFIEYKNVKIKHDINIDVYQYVDDSQAGLNSTQNVNAGTNEKPSSSDQHSPQKNINRILTRSQPREENATVVDNFGANDKSFALGLRDRMVLIPSGKFSMGDDKTGRVDVRMATPFLMDKYPLTQAIYEFVMKSDDYKQLMKFRPCCFLGDDLPVENISWFEAINFCNALSKMYELEEVYEVRGNDVKINYTSIGFRLPTEAEWEYGCRGNKIDDPYGNLDNISWYNKNSGNQTHEVGMKLPNAFGLYDMLGNVFEWCNDWYGLAFGKEPQENPIGPVKGIERVLRGGSWSEFAKNIRPSYRYRMNPFSFDDNCGLRLVLPISQKLAADNRSVNSRKRGGVNGR